MSRVSVGNCHAYTKIEKRKLKENHINLCDIYNNASLNFLNITCPLLAGHGIGQGQYHHLCVHFHSKLAFLSCWNLALIFVGGSLNQTDRMHSSNMPKLIRNYIHKKKKKDQN